MEITSKWLEKYKFKVNDGRHSDLLLDVSPIYGGEDKGPSALEMTIMALTTCLGTTFKMIADKMNLKISDLQLNSTANKAEKDKTVTDIHIWINVKSTESKEKLHKCLELAEENCPVDTIFRLANIPVETKLKILK